MVKRKAPPKPRVFIGSSTESVGIAYAVQRNLDRDAEVTVWPQGIFELSASAFDSLIKALGKSDFGIFVFAPSDTVRLRRRNYAAVRDNVVFELGLFIGKLGQKRTFFVVPDGKDNLRVPTDLAGIVPGKYNAKRKDKNFQAALGPFCDQVRGQIKKLRSIDKPRRAIQRKRSDTVRTIAERPAASRSQRGRRRSL